VIRLRLLGKGAGSRFKNWGQCVVFLFRYSSAMENRGYAVTVQDDSLQD